MTWFTREGSKAFNERLGTLLDEFAAEIAREVGSGFQALILGGGYGRSEGACVLRDGEESLYNDLDFFLIAGPGYRLSDRISRITHAYAQRLGIEVDIGRPLSIADLQTLPNQLMWHDLVNGHIVILGDRDILTVNTPSWFAGPVPQVEALRLMLNRGAGLLQAIIEAYALVHDEGHVIPDPDFIRRNQAKCELAFGDSFLITAGSYTVNLPDRLERLKDTLDSDTPTTLAAVSAGVTAWLADDYERAITFKQRPDTFPTGQPSLALLLETARKWTALNMLEEQQRTGRIWSEPSNYAEDRFIREPDQHTLRSIPRNLAKNLRNGHLSLRYPRESLYTSLMQLLCTPDPGSPRWDSASSQFLPLWHRFN